MLLAVLFVLELAEDELLEVLLFLAFFVLELVEELPVVLFDEAFEPLAVPDFAVLSEEELPLVLSPGFCGGVPLGFCGGLPLGFCGGFVLLPPAVPPFAFALPFCVAPFCVPPEFPFVTLPSAACVLPPLFFWAPS